MHTQRAEGALYGRRRGMVASLDERILRESLVRAEAAITVFTADRRFLAVNDRYLELTGYSRDDIESHRVGENLRLDPLAEDRFIEVITSAIAAGEADILRKNGEPLAVEYVVIPTAIRSEEHTSELQSRRDLVCRLLLEK